MILKLGSTGDAVRELQRALIAAGYGPDDNPAWADDDFGPQTEAAVKAFQARPELHLTEAPGEVDWPDGGTARALRAVAPTGNFYLDVISKSPLYHSSKRCADLAMLEPVTRAAVVAILADAKAAGHPLLVFETFRSQTRQAFLFAEGSTQLRRVGVHGYGLACDLVKDKDGEPSWDGDFSFLGALAKKHGLIWGGDWGQPGVRHSFVDADHVQRVRVADQDRLFSGAWFPDEKYNPYGEKA